MQEAGEIGPEDKPTAEEMARPRWPRHFDKNRKDKKASNKEWQSKTDPDRACDACDRIAKMKDGRTHLAYKAEHAVGLAAEMIVAAEIFPPTWWPGHCGPT
jgi:hypothetical protein